MARKPWEYSDKEHREAIRSLNARLAKAEDKPTLVKLLKCYTKKTKN